MEQNPRKIIIRSIGIVFFLFIIIFGYSRFGRYINGPQVIEISITDYQTVEDLDVLVSGIVRNTEMMVINGRTITLSDKHEFEEVVALSPGLSTVMIDLEDSFGGAEHYEYNVYSTANEVLYETTYNEAQKALTELEAEVLTQINE